MRAMAVQNVLAGYSLEEYFPELQNCILVCATEKRTEEDIDRYVQHLERILSKLSAPTCPVKPNF